MESGSLKAVFLSYSRDDVEAAKFIAEALRRHGVEVWLDQNELRGGDAWDAKIRRQIKECALFMPIISAHTQKRDEGYFRLEWKLAVERTHLMLEGVPFLAPVAIDDTPESGAAVPAELLRVQWMRLPGALPTPQFVGQVKRLLDAPRRPEPAGIPGAGSAQPASTAKSRTGFPAWAVVALVALVLGMGAYVLMRPAEKEAAATLAPVASGAKPETPDSLPTDKSIAVLPFVNMSSDKENAYFCDGVQEDILTNLANIAELRVVSRTSVEQYRGTTKPIRQIAQELGVAWVLEGSVQREGGKVRVTGQLINAASDEHMWAKAYDRDIADIFAIQSELAQTIAAALQTTLSPREKSLVERQPTTNTAAYDLYLKARAITMNDASFSPSEAQKLESLLSAAVELDPNFAEAWGGLADVHARVYFVGYDTSADRLAKAKAAIDKAVGLAPDSPETAREIGQYYYLTQRDYARAAEQLEKFARMEPNAGIAWTFLGVVQRSEGRWLDAIASERRGVHLDPAGVGYARNLLASLRMCRRYDEALAMARKIVAMNTGSIDQFSIVAATEFGATGDTREAGEFLASQEAKDPNPDRFVGYHKLLAQMHGDFAEAVRLDRLQPYTVEDNPGIFAKRVQALYAAEAYRALGDVPAARARLGDFPAQLRARLVSEPNNGPIWQALGRMEAILGNNDEALRCAEKATGLPEAKDGFDGPPAWINLAIVHAWTGDKAKAIAELADILRRPSYLNVNSMRCEAPYVILRGDPRFEALINDPKNNAPLF